MQNQPEKEIDPAVLAQQIAAISDALNKLIKSGLNKRTIAVLVRDETGVGLNETLRVINGLQVLKQRYTTLQPVTPKAK